MTFTSIPNGVRIVHIGNVFGVEFLNTVGCINGSEDTGAPLDDLAARHGGAWRSHILPLISSAYTHLNTLAYSLEDQTAQGDALFTTAPTGGDNGTCNVASACMVAAFKTAKRGRTYQGRTYCGPLTIDKMDDTGTQWLSATVASWNAAWAAYKDAVDPTVGDNGAMAVCSKGSPTKGIAPHVEKVTAIMCRRPIGSQRGRLT